MHKENLLPVVAEPAMDPTELESNLVAIKTHPSCQMTDGGSRFAKKLCSTMCKQPIAALLAPPLVNLAFVLEWLDHPIK